MDDQLTTSQVLRFSAELPVLSPELIHENAAYIGNFVDLKVLKARLEMLDQPSLNARKLKEQEQLFLACINAEVLKVNNVCTRAVLEIEDGLRYLTRKLSEPLEREHVAMLQTECDALLSSMCQLEQYVKLCESSFSYAMRKHDSIIGSASSAWFETCMQDEYFTNIPFRVLVLQLGNLYSLVRKRLYVPEVSTGKKQERVKLFWIKKDDLLKVQGWILRHMSMSEVHHQKIKERAGDEEYEVDPAISVTSIYFDGPKFELYNNFVHALPDSKLVRVSWNGEERTDVRISFQSQSGITETVPIKYKHIGPFLSGEWRFDQYTQKLLGKGKISSEASKEMINSAESIHNVIKEKALRSVLRVSVDRYEFESECGEIQARLDTWPTMVKESGGGKRWKRDTHAAHIKGREKTSLHMHLLRVTTSKTDIEWISDLLDMGLMCVVPSLKHPFDYFLYGVAKFYGKQLDTLPSWLPALHEFTHKTASGMKRAGSVGGGIDHIESQFSTADIFSVSDFHSVSAYSEWTSSSDEEMESIPYVASPTAQLSRASSTARLALPSGASSPANEKSRSLNSTGPKESEKRKSTEVPLPPLSHSPSKTKVTSVTIDVPKPTMSPPYQPPQTTPQKPAPSQKPFLSTSPAPAQTKVPPSQKATTLTPPPLQSPKAKPEDPTTQQPTKPKTPTVKPIEELTPVRQTVRVEPKTFFSNERTLLQWMNAIVVLSTLAIAMIGIGDSKAKIAGYILLPISIIFGLYALAIYHLRLRAIASRSHSRFFQDNYGPYFLVVVFLTGIVLAAVVPAIHQSSVGTNPEARNYPFVPPLLPYAPESYSFSAPLPVELFPYSERALGMAAVTTLLNAVSQTPELKLALSPSLAPTESVSVITSFSLTNLSTTENLPYSLQTVFNLQTNKTESILAFTNKLPHFKKIKNFPKHSSSEGRGTEVFDLSLDCKSALLYYKASLLKSVHPNDWEDVERYFPSTLSSLGINTTVARLPFTSEGFSEHRWRQDVSLANGPASLSLSLLYNCTDLACSVGSVSESQLPVKATLEVFVPEQFRNYETFKASRLLMETIITSQYSSWPSFC